MSTKAISELYKRLDIKANKVQDVLEDIPSIYADAHDLYALYLHEIKNLQMKMADLKPDIYQGYRCNFQKEYHKTEIEEILLMKNKDYKDLYFKLEKYNNFIKEIDKLYQLLSNMNFLISSYLKLKEKSGK